MTTSKSPNLRLDISGAKLRNAIFCLDPQDSSRNTLDLVFNAEKYNDPNATIITIYNIHPTLGNYIERFMKRFGTPGRASPIKSRS